ncbi:DNRLRE domain-containing protein [Syntrophomonas palmitatica]|uniref:DNRLRE domain-containing protein n=1 Tax=Syntrophomonas palmitatica TaxID=402877 RepID=UPI0006D21114|nr:DNRLRE domain-containing protein [Syntrophomonas palmitatica]
MKFDSLESVQFASTSEWSPETNLTTVDPSALYAGQFMQPGDSFRSYLQFDLSYREEKTEIKGVETYLQLFIYRNEIPSGTIALNLYPLSEPWNQYTINWNNQAAYRKDLNCQFVIPSMWQGFIMLDITPLAQRWLQYLIPNYGLVLIGHEYHNRVLAFASPEYPERDKIPKLIVASKE